MKRRYEKDGLKGYGKDERKETNEKKGREQPFVEIRGPERLRDFASVFGEQLELMEAKMLRYLDSL